MADQRILDKATVENITQIRFVLYNLDKADPNAEQTQTTATQVMEWAKSTVGFSQEKIDAILHPKKLVTVDGNFIDEKYLPYTNLAEAIVEEIYRNHISITALPERVKEYQEIRKQQDAKERQRAEAELAQKHKLTWHQVVQSWTTTQTQIAQIDPASKAPGLLDAITTSVTPELVFNAPDTTRQVVEIVSEVTPSIPATALPGVARDLTENVVAELNSQTGALLKVATKKIRATAPTITEAQARTAAAELVALEIIEPDASEEKIKRLVKKITLDLEKDGHLVSERLVDDATKLLSGFNIDASLPEKIEQTIALEVQEQTDLDPETAKIIAKEFIAYRIPELAYHASVKAVSANPNETLLQRQARQMDIFNNINEAAVAFSHRLPSTALNQLMGKDVKLNRVLRVMQQFAPPPPSIYEAKNYQITDEQGRAQDNPLIKGFQAETQERTARSKDESLQTIDRLKSELQSQTPSQANNATLQEIDRLRNELLNQVPGQANNATLQAIEQLRSELLKQIPSEEIYQSRDRERTPQSHPGADYFKDEIRGRFTSRIKNEAWQALEGWIKGPSVGEVVPEGVTVGATVAATAAIWALPIGAPLVVAVGLEQGLTKGWIVYAGTNAANQLTFAITEAGREFLASQAARVAGGTALTTTAQTIAGVAGKTASATGLAASISRLLLSLGVANPEPITKTILIAITTLLLSGKKLWNWVREHGWKAAVVITSAALGFLFGGPLLGIIGAAAGLTVALAATGQLTTLTSITSTSVLQGVGQGASHVFASITNLAVVEIATPIIVIILSIPIVVALLLFIINTGAYVVPPSTNPLQNPSQSQYITVTKEADISALANAQLPKTVTYRITVSAPEGALSNITFSNECSVIKEGSPPPCSHPVPSAIPPTIDSATPFSFEYAQTYDSAFTDSIVSDSFTVTANSPGGQATSVASASVTIGTPPTQCFNIVGSNWPANYKTNVLTAIGTLTSSYTAYSAKVCRAGTIRIVYDTSKNPEGWGYYGGSTIYLNGGGLNSQINALYIVAHESGHHFQSVAMPALYRQYLDTPGIAGEIPLCSYVNTYLYSEAFAESIALYVTHDQASSWVSRCSGTFQAKYPNHWDFANSVIFR